jgi:formyltetrahydrofolate deformylase
VTRLLLIACADAKGIVARSTGALFAQDLNVVSNREFVDTAAGRFFMRTEFEGDLDEERLRRDLAEILPADASVTLTAPRRKRLVVLATREPHCLGDLLIRCEFGSLNAEIAAVVSNHEVLGDLVRRAGIPFHAVPHEGLSREDHEARLQKAIAPYAPDLLVLAKYMRILTPAFTAAYEHRAINIHHSFLPAFVGARPYHQAHERGVKIIGATAHFVTADLDKGPILAQDVIPVDHTRSPQEMAAEGRDVETIVLARALRLVLEDRVFVCGNRTIIFD